MNLQQRVVLLERLGNFLLSGDEEWAVAVEKAHEENAWFIPEFTHYQSAHIAASFLSPDRMRAWIKQYAIPDNQPSSKNIGIVMAGNIPLAGFHDFLCAFLSGHRQIIKPSSKDRVLINTIIDQLKKWDDEVSDYICTAEQLRGCDAYIATGSNNSGRYFDYYFNKYPHIIRRNRTSAAILTGNETLEDLTALADDVYLYFGLGCRNVTKIYVPENYEFFPLLESFKKYNALSENHKYKNNYDYQLAILIINKLYYMTNGSLLLQENKGLFSPISQLHYETYRDMGEIKTFLHAHHDVQCIVGEGHLPFGQAQHPALDDYADKADTMQFLLDL